MTRRKPSEEDKPKKKTKEHVKKEEIDRLHSILDIDDEEEMEKEIKKVLKDRRQKIHRQVADMESKNKRMLMWVGVIIAMLVIVSFWVFKFNEIVTRPIMSTSQEIKDIDFEQTKEALTTTLDKVRSGIEEIKQEAKKFEEERVQQDEEVQQEEEEITPFPSE
ncbi:MAG: hypothetical protein ABIG10_00105 [bacterium]